MTAKPPPASRSDRATGPTIESSFGLPWRLDVQGTSARFLRSDGRAAIGASIDLQRDEGLQLLPDPERRLALLQHVVDAANASVQRQAIPLLQRLRPPEQETGRRSAMRTPLQLVTLALRDLRHHIVFDQEGELSREAFDAMLGRADAALALGDEPSPGCAEAQARCSARGESPVARAHGGQHAQ